jgi:hypothetical protein
MVSEAVAHLPAAVSLLLLEALFMEISGVRLALTWPRRLCLLRVLLCKPLLQAFPFPSTLGEVTLHPPSPASVFIYRSPGKCPFPPLQWSFPHTPTFTSFPAPGCWACATAPAFSSRLVCLQFREPLSPLQHSGRPTLFATCLLLLLFIIQFGFFLFFPWVGVSLSRGLC